MIRNKILSIIIMISVFVNNNPSQHKVISTKGNKVTVDFNPKINLDSKKKYYLRCLNANIVYCMPNVISGVNNKLYYYINGANVGASFRTITFDAGLYSLLDINRTISYFTTDPNNGDNSKLIQFSADSATSKIYVTFDQPNTCISVFFPDSITSMLGFDLSQGDSSKAFTIGNNPVKTSIKSKNQAQLNSLQNILIKCDIVSGSYQNSQLSNIIACVTPDVASYSTIIYSPYHPLRLPIDVDTIESMTLTLIDQDGKEVDMGTDNGTLPPELWSVQLDIEEVEFARLL